MRKIILTILWNKIIEYLQDNEDLLIAQSRQAESAHDPTVMQPISELRARLAADGLLHKKREG